jgi:FtsH-binding integral membrane protein
MLDEDDLPRERVRPQAVSAQSGGIVALVLGCTLLLAACILMVFNVLLFTSGLFGIPIEIAQIGALIGTMGVAVLGIAGISFGVRGWLAASRQQEPTAFGAAGTMAAIVGLIAWLIASTDLMLILFSA